MRLNIKDEGSSFIRGFLFSQLNVGLKLIRGGEGVYKCQESP